MDDNDDYRIIAEPQKREVESDAPTLAEWRLMVLEFIKDLERNVKSTENNLREDLRGNRTEISILRTSDISDIRSEMNAIRAEVSATRREISDVQTKISEVRREIETKMITSDNHSVVEIEKLKTESRSEGEKDSYKKTGIGGAIALAFIMIIKYLGLI